MVQDSYLYVYCGCYFYYNIRSYLCSSLFSQSENQELKHKIDEYEQIHAKDKKNQFAGK
jgi:hypothetical protein